MYDFALKNFLYLHFVKMYIQPYENRVFVCRDTVC